MISIDRRSCTRFLLRLPLTVRWLDEGNIGNAATQAQDVSSQGVYFILPKGLKEGTSLEIVMTLPEWLAKKVVVHVRCCGRVVRNSPEYPGHMGVAAFVERYRISRE